MNRSKKIVITGGPGGGKTTAIDLFRREFNEKIAIVPESATLLFSNGISRGNNEREIRTTQKAIYQIQKTTESLQTEINPGQILICDRGSLDGLAYWPTSEESFFNELNSNIEQELKEYEAVIFFETAAKANKDISSNNPFRNENSQKAIEIDDRLQLIWKKHPKFHLVSSHESFVEKIMLGIQCINQVFAEVNSSN